jgi:hypothetical protein
MKRAAVPTLVSVALMAAGSVALTAAPASADPPTPGEASVLELVGTYTTGLASGDGETTSAEVASIAGSRLYVSNATDASVDIVDVSDPAAPKRLRRVDLSAHGESVTSVAASPDGLVVAALERGSDPGRLVFMSPGGSNLRPVEVGVGPDMVTFAPGGRVLVANEGEPTGYGPGFVDPPGSVSVVETPPRARLVAHTIDFTAFDPGGPRAAELDPDVRIFGSPLPSLDLEPEYVTVSEDGGTAWVSLQENNAIAVVDLATRTVERIDALGVKDHSVAPNGLDGSDQDGGINIATWANVRGMYQPDALASFVVDGHPYVLSANEGDARDWPGLVEAARLRSVTTDASFGPARANSQIGRLNVTTRPPAASAPQSIVYAFGARSFSVWDGLDGSLTYDSGDILERTVAEELPGSFNASNTSNGFDSRSDDKGPEPEAAAVATVDGTTYGFVGLERVGGVVVVDLDEPASPSVVQYVNNRAFGGDAVGPDSGPEVIDVLAAGESPTGRALVAVANEVTGTVSLYTT